MVFYPEYDLGGVKRLCRAGDADMPLGIDVYAVKLERGETFCVTAETKETVVLLLNGRVKLTADGETHKGRRRRVPDMKHMRTLCVHAAAKQDIIVDAARPSEVLVIQTENGLNFGAEVFEKISRTYPFCAASALEVGELIPEDGEDAVPCLCPQLRYYPYAAKESGCEAEGESLRAGACQLSADGSGTAEDVYSIRVLRKE